MSEKNIPIKNKVVVNIILTGLLTGTLDAIAALLLNYKTAPALIFKLIASGFFGKAAFAGGGEMIAAGVIFHYIIAIAFSSVFYLLYPFFYNGLRNRYFVAFIYGFTAWLIMNLVVVPLSKIGRGHIQLPAILIGVTVLVVCIGVPVVIIAHRQYKKAGKLL